MLSLSLEFLIFLELVVVQALNKSFRSISMENISYITRDRNYMHYKDAEYD